MAPVYGQLAVDSSGHEAVCCLPNQFGDEFGRGNDSERFLFTSITDECVSGVVSLKRCRCNLKLGD